VAPEKPKIPCAIYVRQSRTHDGSESMERQVESGREAAARFGCEVVAELIEPPSTSGYKARGTKRPEFKELLRLVKAGTVQAVVVYKSDRLSRGGGPGWAPFIEAAETAGLDIDHLVLSPSGWMSEFEIGIRATMDREESKKISDRQKDILSAGAKRGYPSSGGRRPLGRMADGVTPHPGEYWRVIKAVDELLAGMTTFYSVARLWNDQGFLTPNGHKWDVSMVVRALTSPRMAGVRVLPDKSIVQGNWAPIIDQEKWEAICFLAEARKGTRVVLGRPSAFFLTPLVKCGRCGKALGGWTRPGSGERRYTCKPKGSGGCHGISITAAHVESRAKKLIIGTLCDPRFREDLAEGVGHTRQHRLELTAEARSIKVQQTKLLDLYLGDGLAKALYEPKAYALAQRLKEIEEQLNTFMPTNLFNVPTTPDQFEAEWDDIPLETKRNLAQLVVEKITIHPSKLLGGRFDESRIEIDPRDLGATGGSSLSPVAV
jgi:DNA invertase Pin-like site-specific DNA recombinase